MATLTVKKVSGGDYTTIQTAVAAANTIGDVIQILDSGVYNEAISALHSGGFGKSFKIEAASGQTPTIDGTSLSSNYAIDNAILPTTFAVSTVELVGIKFTNWSYNAVLKSLAGVRYVASQCTIEDSSSFIERPPAGGSSTPTTITRCKFRNTDRIFVNTNSDFHGLVTNVDYYAAANKSCIDSENNSRVNLIVKQCSILTRDTISNFAIRAGVVENCIVRNAADGSGSATAIHAESSFSNNSVSGLFANVEVGGGTAGVAAITSNPLFTSEADPNPNLIIQSTSPCIDAGKDTGITIDFLGTARPQGSAFDIGAYELQIGVCLTGVTINSLTSVTATLDNDPTVSTVDDPTDWTFSTTSPLANIPTAIAVTQGSTIREWTVTLAGEGLSAGVTYVLTAPNLANSSGASTCKSFSFAVPSNLAPTASDHDFPKPPLEIVTHMIGKWSDHLNGRLTTRLDQGWEPTQNYIIVESTFGFPIEGRLYVDGMLVSYTTKTDTKFSGITTTTPRILATREGSLVILDERSVKPNG